MKLKGFILAAALGSMMWQPATAALTDSEDYPIIYLKGAMTGWQSNDDYKFTRTGNVYTLSLPSLDGLFKLADDEWKNVDFGAESGILSLTGSKATRLVTKGANLKAEGLGQTDISFTYTPGAQTLVVNFVVDGVPIDDPIIDPGHTVSGTLPVLHINVYKTDADGNFLTDGDGNKIYENEINDYNLSHKNYFAGNYWLDLNGCEWMEAEGAASVGSEDAPLALQIKARGNWTRIGYSKKPFKLKLDKKQNLLGLTPSKSKHYAILAHADDYFGYLRNFVGFNLGDRIGLPWSPGQQPVEVVINGDYRGLYFLTESIRVGDGRVGIKELKDNETDPTLASGGYLIELDNYDEDDDAQIQMQEQAFVSGHYLDVLRITFNTPEKYSDLQRRFVTDQFTTMNGYVGSNNDALWQYIDLDDAARYYIVKEMISDVESFHGSTYMYRDRGEGQKWHFSPLWDCGNAFAGQTDSYFYEGDPFGNTWIPSMRANTRFNDKVKETWQWFMGNEYDGLIADIDAYVGHIAEAAKYDAMRWQGEETPSGGVPVVDNTNITERRNNAVYRLESKIAWLNSQWGNPDSSKAEPERDATAAAPLPDYLQGSSAIAEIDADDEATEYFDLTGVRIARPAAGQIVIVRRGHKVMKAIVR